MKAHRLAALAVTPLIAAGVLTSCSSDSLSDAQACTEVKDAVQQAGITAGAATDPSNFGKLAEAAPKIQEIAERTESDFKNDLSNISTAFSKMGELVGADGKPDTAKVLEFAKDPQFLTDMQGSLTKLSEVCGGLGG